ncbi:HAMP domain-containing sensor histidine kinase [Algoriphagus boritolerans]|uniref:sensor histidine kinase n=1 Tax=Algoriphagus boritolerans TaxID=308111 RepID=UPI000A7D539D
MPWIEKNELLVFFGKDQADSINQLQTLTSKIIISITRDSLDFDKIKEFLQAELDRRKIDINYQLIQVNRRIPRLGEANPPQENPGIEKPNMPFMTISRSTFLPPGQALELYFENISLTILRRGIFEILTSLLFLSIIAYAFYYLYQTIKNQKEIAEIKQDLIANITHEFKTPIATTLSAIEGIQQFNPENDPSKTSRYLGISKNQMFKLNQMVEKLLETATLDSDQLVLKKETIEPEILLRQLVQKFQTLAPEKKIDLIMPAHCKTIFADPFHFENALSNLIDNAIKYGGNEIRICLDQKGMNKVRIHDNGGNIPSEQKARVFEQFYRIPKGDLHDVKGFGIGLYYVKKILEKHEGKIELEAGKNSTTFITYWP